MITREGIRDEITLRVELKPLGSGEWETVADDLHRRLGLAHEGLNFRVERAGEGELPRFELKAKRTVDLRDQPIGAAARMSGVDLIGGSLSTARGAAARRLRGAEGAVRRRRRCRRSRQRTSAPRWH